MTTDADEGRAWVSAGEGPGVITPDGCAVDLYAVLEGRGEPEIISAAVPEGASILELGAGAGRLVHPLLALGHEVVAVDESAEMLAHVRGAVTVHSTIQALALDRRFDVVLPATHFVNDPDDAKRQAYLRACRDHLAPGGCVILQRHEPDWFEVAEDGDAVADGITFALRGVSRPGPGLLAARMEYTLPDGRSWTHQFVTRRLDDDELQDELTAAGLTVDAYLQPRTDWVRAVAT